MARVPCSGGGNLAAGTGASDLLNARGLTGAVALT